MSVVVPNEYLVGINTCFGESCTSKERKLNTFLSLKKKLELPDRLLVEYLFCPNPVVAFEATAAMTVDPDKPMPPETTIRFSILDIPKSALEIQQPMKETKK